MSQPIIRTSDMRKKMGDQTAESTVFGLPSTSNQPKTSQGKTKKK